MTGRRAILIGNSVSYGDTSRDVKASVVRSVLRQLQDDLEGLGDFAFTSFNVLIDKGTDAVRRELLRSIRTASRAEEQLLLYYFGHGVIPPFGDELYLYCRGSRHTEPPTMLKFSDIVEMMHSYSVPAAIVMLDCCYAGTVASKMRLLDEYKGKYFLMASVTWKEKAAIDYGETPIGVFTRYALNAFKNPGARLPHTRDVTFRSYYDLVERLAVAKSQQRAMSADGNLGGDIFFKQTSTPKIQAGARRTVPKKSAYRKMLMVGQLLLAKEYPSLASLYAFVGQLKPPEFLQPVKVGKNKVEYQCSSKDSFSSYVGLCKWFGIVEDSLPLRLTAAGKTMVRQQGAKFNEGLHAAILEKWSQYGVGISDLEDAIGIRIRNSGIPSSERIFTDISLSKKMRMSKKIFNLLLDLTGYVGAVNYSAERTFFLAIPEETKLDDL